MPSPTAGGLAAGGCDGPVGAAPLPPGRLWAAVATHRAWGGAGHAGPAVDDDRGRHGKLVAGEAVGQVRLAWRLESVPTGPAGHLKAIVTCCYYDGR